MSNKRKEQIRKGKTGELAERGFPGWCGGRSQGQRRPPHLGARRQEAWAPGDDVNGKDMPAVPGTRRPNQTEEGPLELAGAQAGERLSSAAVTQPH